MTEVTTETPAKEVVETPEETPEQIEARELEEARENFGEVCPDLAESYDELSAKAREKVLLKRLAAKASETSTPTSTPEVAQEPNGTISPSPSINEPPVMDVGRMTSMVSKAFEDQDAAGLVDALTQQIEFTNSNTQQLGLALVEVYDKLESLEASVASDRVPGSIRGSMSAVKGAQEADIAEAVKLIRSGDVKSPKAALKLAIFNRQQEIEAAGGGIAQTARRKAAGVAASRAAGTSRAPGQQAQRLPANEAEFKELMRKEAQEQK